MPIKVDVRVREYNGGQSCEAVATSGAYRFRVDTGTSEVEWTMKLDSGELDPIEHFEVPESLSIEMLTQLLIAVAQTRYKGLSELGVLRFLHDEVSTFCKEMDETDDRGDC